MTRALLSTFLLILITVSPRWVSAQSVLWRADLGAFGYGARPNPRYIGGKPYLAGKRTDIGVLFVNRDEVIVYFVTEAAPAGLMRRDSRAATDRFRLEIVAFDAASGQLKYHKAVPGRAGFNSIFLTYKGNFLIRSGDSLSLYTPGYQLIRERKLPLTGEFDSWQLRMSGSRRTVLADHYVVKRVIDDVLDAESLNPIATLEGDWYPVFDVSDSSILKADPDHSLIVVGGFDGKAAPFTGHLNCVAEPRLLKDADVLNACGNEVALFRSNGTVVMKDRIGSQEHFEELVEFSAGQSFVALSARENKGGGFWDTTIRRGPTRIIVYDLTNSRRLSAISVQPLPKEDYDFALSPDGKAVAVMVDGRLIFYSDISEPPQTSK